MRLAIDASQEAYSRGQICSNALRLRFDATRFRTHGVEVQALQRGDPSNALLAKAFLLLPMFRAT